MPNSHPPECTLRLRVAGRFGIVIPSKDNRYSFKPDREYRMSPTAYHRMLEHLKRISRSENEYYSVLGQLLVDKPGSWDIGKIYILKGRGAMKLVGVHQPEPDRITLNFHTMTGLNYWAAEDEVSQEATADLLELFEDGERRAGFEHHAKQLEAWRKELADEK